MLARAQCQPFVLVWCSLIYFLWALSLILCSSKNPISRSKRHSEVIFKGWHEFLCMILLLAIYPCPSKRIQLRTNLDGEFVFNRPWAGSELSWNKCSHYLRENHSHTPLRSCVRWYQNALHKPFNAMWWKKFIEHLLHAKQMCRAKKSNKKISFH